MKKASTQGWVAYEGKQPKHVPKGVTFVETNKEYTLALLKNLTNDALQKAMNKGAHHLDGRLVKDALKRLRCKLEDVVIIPMSVRLPDERGHRGTMYFIVPVGDPKRAAILAAPVAADDAAEFLA